MPNVDQQFLNFLIFGFWREYLAWKYTPPLHDYLAKFQLRSKFKAFAVVGHAFLHMAYDLPRTVADSFELAPPLVVDQRQRRLVFLRVRPVFDKVFETCSRDRKLFGVLALPCKLLGRRAALLRKEAKWIQELRTIAWVHGEILAHHPQRQNLENQLLNGVIAAGNQVIKYYWNPLYWTAFLTPPVLLAVPILPARFTAWIELHWAGTVVAVELAAAMYFYAVYRGLVRVTERLGYALYRLHLVSVVELGGLDRLREFTALANEMEGPSSR